ncbi:hypothetical protein J5Y09_12190 [Roseomonas sp. PWR1]|uniref:Uncharacterized protein n=1 Tax=Roseomonas nitratireducens TaxID=2820810 RepID=A0ABS4ATJ0_9PROT|nr:hypothetical protein [Neoroseomonas nitratireducens]MBP0464670.1 hypothetical protein [Neoroseomonas nitratireducens]
MFIRAMAVGMVGAALAGTALVATGAGIALLACAAKRRAEARAAWPEEAPPPPPDDEES